MFRWRSKDLDRTGVLRLVEEASPQRGFSNNLVLVFYSHACHNHVNCKKVSRSCHRRKLRLNRGPNTRILVLHGQETSQIPIDTLVATGSGPNEKMISLSRPASFSSGGTKNVDAYVVQDRGRTLFVLLILWLVKRVSG